jgi:uncharacterized protein YndB with AHSA1/START domain
MTELVFTKDIHSPPETVFNLIADLPNYGKWLSTSELFKDVMEISDNPIKLGTTYVDKGQFSTLTGTVTEFDPPRSITFSQGMPFRSVFLTGHLTIDIRYSLEPRNGGTHVTRIVTLKMSGLVWLAQPLLIRSIQRESERILDKMKVYLEKPSAT